MQSCRGGVAWRIGEYCIDQTEDVIRNAWLYASVMSGWNFEAIESIFRDWVGKHCARLWCLCDYTCMYTRASMP
jgi:hypothetical protein